MSFAIILLPTCSYIQSRVMLHIQTGSQLLTVEWIPYVTREATPEQPHSVALF